MNSRTTIAFASLAKINPLRTKDFSKLRQNSGFNLGLQMTIKWPKMTQMSSNKHRNVENCILIIFNSGLFFISQTEKSL